MKTTADQAKMVWNMLQDFDTLDKMQAKFVEEATGAGGATWAIERFAGDMFFARQMARMVRPLLEARETTAGRWGRSLTDAEWLTLVKDARRETTDRLVRLHGRHNSTSMLQNTINEWEAEAMSRFVDRLGYWLMDA